MPVPSDHEVAQLLRRLFGGEHEVNSPRTPATSSVTTPGQVKILRSAFSIGLILIMLFLFFTQAPGIITNFFHGFSGTFPSPAS